MHVGIERHDVTWPDHPIGRFLEPGIAARPGGQHTPLVPPSVVGGVRRHQDRPKFGFGDTRAQRLAHSLHAQLGNADRVAKTGNLVFILYHAGTFDQGRCVDDVKANLHQRLHRAGIQPVDRNAHPAPTDTRTDRVGEPPIAVSEVKTGIERRHQEGRQIVVHIRVAAVVGTGQGGPAVPLQQQDHRRDTGLKKTVFPHFGDITQGQRVGEKAQVHVPALHLRQNTPPPIGSQAFRVDQGRIERIVPRNRPHGVAPPRHGPGPPVRGSCRRRPTPPASRRCRLRSGWRARTDAHPAAHRCHAEAVRCPACASRPRRC